MKKLLILALFFCCVNSGLLKSSEAQNEKQISTVEGRRRMYARASSFNTSITNPNAASISSVKTDKGNARVSFARPQNEPIDSATGMFYTEDFREGDIGGDGKNFESIQEEDEQKNKKEYYQLTRINSADNVMVQAALKEAGIPCLVNRQPDQQVRQRRKRDEIEIVTHEAGTNTETQQSSLCEQIVGRFKNCFVGGLSLFTTVLVYDFFNKNPPETCEYPKLCVTPT